MDQIHRDERRWAILFARAILGFIFVMAGVWKVFELGPLEHARRLFIVLYADTFLPPWLLWASGTTIPFIELVLEPLYEFNTHVIPRAALLLFVLVMPRSDDRFSIDHWLTRGPRDA